MNSVQSNTDKPWSEHKIEQPIWTQSKKLTECQPILEKSITISNKLKPTMESPQSGIKRIIDSQSDEPILIPKQKRIFIEKLTPTEPKFNHYDEEVKVVSNEYKKYSSNCTPKRISRISNYMKESFPEDLIKQVSPILDPIKKKMLFTSLSTPKLDTEFDENQ